MASPTTLNVWRGDEPCRCVADHNPEPVSWDLHHVHPVGLGGPADGEVVPLCATGHRAVHALIDRAMRAGVPPPELPWSDRGRVRSPLLLELAERGYLAATAPTGRPRP